MSTPKTLLAASVATFFTIAQASAQEESHTILPNELTDIPVALTVQKGEGPTTLFTHGNEHRQETQYQATAEIGPYSPKARYLSQLFASLEPWIGQYCIDHSASGARMVTPVLETDEISIDNSGTNGNIKVNFDFSCLEFVVE